MPFPYEELYDAYVLEDSEALIKLFGPRVDQWIRDLLWMTPDYKNQCWQLEMKQAATAYLVKKFRSKFFNTKFADGRHVYYSVRPTVWDVIRKTFYGLHSHPSPPLSTIKKRKKHGKPVFKDDELQHQIPIEELLDHIDTPLSPIYQEFLAAPDWYKAEMEALFKQWAAERALEISDEKGWEFVRFLYEFEISVAETAQVCDIAESTIRGRFKALGVRIVEAATPEQFDIGEEVFGEGWKEAAEKATVGVAVDRAKKSPKITRIDDFVENSAAHFGKSIHRNLRGAGAA